MKKIVLAALLAAGCVSQQEAETRATNLAKLLGYDVEIVVCDNPNRSFEHHCAVRVRQSSQPIAISCDSVGCRILAR